jgi:hypothetical protein
LGVLVLRRRSGTLQKPISREGCGALVSDNREASSEVQVSSYKSVSADVRHVDATKKLIYIYIYIYIYISYHQSSEL